jgi:hypothetical protein
MPVKGGETFVIEEMELRARSDKPGRWLCVRCGYDPLKPVLVQLRRNDVFTATTDSAISEEHNYYHSQRAVWLGSS